MLNIYSVSRQTSLSRFGTTTDDVIFDRVNFTGTCQMAVVVTVSLKSLVVIDFKIRIVRACLLVSLLHHQHHHHSNIFLIAFWDIILESMGLYSQNLQRYNDNATMLVLAFSVAMTMRDMSSTNECAAISIESIRLNRNRSWKSRPFYYFFNLYVIRYYDINMTC